MFDIGFTEIMLIGVVSLIVIGPERLPTVARTAGTWLGKMRRFVTGVRSDFARELESGDLKKLIGDQREQINELKQMVTEAKTDLQKDANEIVSGTRQQLKAMENDVAAETDTTTDTSGKSIGHATGKASDSKSESAARQDGQSVTSTADTASEQPVGKESGQQP